MFWEFRYPLAGSLMLIPAIAAVMLFTFWYCSYLGLRRGKALLFAALVQAAGTLCLIVTEMRVLSSTPLMRLPWSPMLPLLAAVAFLGLLGFGVGLLVKVYRACVLNIATEPERLPGAASLRAWLGPMNIVAAVGVVVGAYYSLGWSPLATGVGALALLLAFPLLNSLTGSRTSATEPDASAEERRRVLALVESGKVTAEDGAELLSALNQSHASAAHDEPGTISGNRRIMLTGAASLLVGFFLPWLTVHVGQQMRGIMENLMPQAMSQSTANSPHIEYGPDGSVRLVTPGQNQPFNMPVPSVPDNLEVNVRGGDLSYGLGWFILLLGIGTAVLPLVWPTRPANRPLSLVALGAGSLLVLYVFSGYLTTQGLELKVGLILTLLGYAILWTGGVREYLARPGHVGLPAAVAH